VVNSGAPGRVNSSCFTSVNLVTDVLILYPINNIYQFVLQESIKRPLVVCVDPDDDELRDTIYVHNNLHVDTNKPFTFAACLVLFPESRLKCLVMWNTVDWWIGWLVFSASFSKFRGISTFCETRRLGRDPIGILMVWFMLLSANFNNISVISWR
jgi:hypothetical protein